MHFKNPFIILSIATFLMVACSMTQEQANPEPSATATPKEKVMTDITPPSAASPVAFTHVVTTETEYYLGGPQQGRPPEGNLPAGTKVAKSDDANGDYVFVEAQNGVKAWVHANALDSLK